MSSTLIPVSRSIDRNVFSYAFPHAFAHCVLRAGFATAVLLCTAAAQAQDTTPARNDFATYRPTARAVRIAPEEAPMIDGDVSDPVWEKADVIEEFYQLEPVVGILPSERTEVRILYDAQNLYLAIYNYDSDIKNVVANILTRDISLFADDSIRIYFDPVLSRRNVYVFEINSLGARAEGVIQNNAVHLFEWDTIWRGKAMRVEDGWTAELAVVTHFEKLTPHSSWPGQARP